MSERIYMVCNECEEKKLIAKGMPWGFCCLPEEGIEIFNADSAEELKAQIAIGGLNCKGKEDTVMLQVFNEWLEKHGRCKDFGIEVES